MSFFSLLTMAIPAVALLALSASAIWVTTRRQWTTISAPAAALAILPGLVMLISFYALAIHMHLSLGGWPESIGTRNFPASLDRHAEITGWFFSIVLLFALFGLPLALLVCAAGTRLRPFLAHFTLGGIAFVLCFLGIQLGPSEFLDWWWD